MEISYAQSEEYWMEVFLGVVLLLVGGCGLIKSGSMLLQFLGCYVGAVGILVAVMNLNRLLSIFEADNWYGWVQYYIQPPTWLTKIIRRRRHNFQFGLLLLLAMLSYAGYLYQPHHPFSLLSVSAVVMVFGCVGPVVYCCFRPCWAELKH